MCPFSIIAFLQPTTVDKEPYYIVHTKIFLEINLNFLIYFFTSYFTPLYYDDYDALTVSLQLPEMQKSPSRFSC